MQAQGFKLSRIEQVNACWKNAQTNERIYSNPKILRVPQRDALTGIFRHGKYKLKRPGSRYQKEPWTVPRPIRQEDHPLRPIIPPT